MVAVAKQPENYLHLYLVRCGALLCVAVDRQRYNRLKRRLFSDVGDLSHVPDVHLGGAKPGQREGGSGANELAAACNASQRFRLVFGARLSAGSQLCQPSLRSCKFRSI